MSDTSETAEPVAETPEPAAEEVQKIIHYYGTLYDQLVPGERVFGYGQNGEVETDVFFVTLPAVGKDGKFRARQGRAPERPSWRTPPARRNSRLGADLDQRRPEVRQGSRIDDQRVGSAPART